MLKRAYSVLEIKSFDEEAGVIEGMATTPTPDRVGDIVEPKGAKFSLPLPLLWQHSSGDPIGHVTDAKVTADGIRIKASIPRGLLPEIDRAWTLIKSGLVRGLSIGFRALEDGVEPINPKEPWGAQVFKAWEWLELSAVTIPANQDASIQTIKSAYGALSSAAVVRLNSPPGVPGVVQSKGKSAMPTLTERLTQWEGKYTATKDARAQIMRTAEEDGDRVLTDAEDAKYKELGAEEKSILAHIDRIKEQIEEVKANATPVEEDPTPATPGRPTPHILNVKGPKLEPGVEFARYVKCHMLAGKNNPWQALQLAKSMYPDSPRIANVMQAEASQGVTVGKSNVVAASTTGTGWADALVQYQDFAGVFLEWLRPQTIIGRIAGMTRVPFNARVRVQTSGGSAYWTGEGKPKPLTAFSFSNITMAITKVANIAVVTEETLRLATPSADLLVRNALRGALLERLDRDFIDPDSAGTANVQPASITYGATTAAAGGTTNPYVISDLNTAMGSLLATFPDASISGMVILMPARTAFALSQAQNSLGQAAFPSLTIAGGTLGGIPVITSEYLWYGGGLSPGSNGLIVLLHAPSIFLADDGDIRIDTSTETALQMLDNPTNDVVTPTATSLVSMFQTDSVAIRAERVINWKVARTGATYYITNVAYSGLAS